MADELKPCPFCGDDKPYVDVGTVECGTCGALAFGPHSVPADRTGHNWQTRPIESALLARAESAEQLAEAASSQLRAAVDAFEEADGKLEKVRGWRERSLSTECQCSVEYSSRNMCDPSCEWCETDAAGLDEILAPDTSGDGK
jgi:hypothetical protein